MQQEICEEHVTEILLWEKVSEENKSCKQQGNSRNISG